MENKIMEFIKNLEKVKDISVNSYSGENSIDITINDFDGFNDDWGEDFCDLANPELLNEFLEFLDNNCIEKKEDYYDVYEFENFSIHIGYASYDI